MSAFTLRPMRLPALLAVATLLTGLLARQPGRSP